MLIVVIMDKWSNDSACCVVHDVRLYSVLDTVVISGDDVCCIVQGTKRITRQYSLLRTSAPQEVLVRTGQHWSVYTVPVQFFNSQDADNLHTIRKRMPIPFQ